MNTDSLLAVLDAVREALSREDNDFSWSSWQDREAALAELDQLAAGAAAGNAGAILMLRVLFAPTGPIQEVSLSSGWGDEFLRLADAFDAAVEGSGT